MLYWSGAAPFFTYLFDYSCIAALDFLYSFAVLSIFLSCFLAFLRWFSLVDICCFQMRADVVRLVWWQGTLQCSCVGRFNFSVIAVCSNVLSHSVADCVFVHWLLCYDDSLHITLRSLPQFRMFRFNFHVPFISWSCRVFSFLPFSSKPFALSSTSCYFIRQIQFHVAFDARDVRINFICNRLCRVFFVLIP